MSKQTKGNFSKFMAGKGFYVALTFCLIGAGAAAWAAVDRTIDSIDQNNKAILDRASSSLPLSSSESNWGFPSLEEADKPQSGVSKPSASLLFGGYLFILVRGFFRIFQQLRTLGAAGTIARFGLRAASAGRNSHLF